MIRRWLAAGAVVVTTLGVASATSLGTFNQVVLTGAADQLHPCQVQDVEFLSGGTVLGSLLGLLTTTVDQISLDVVAGGDCRGLRPVVIVYGDPNTLDGVDETVALSRTVLSPLSDDSDVVLSVDPLDELNTLLGLNDDPTQVRVSFCPDGATCT